MIRALPKQCFGLLVVLTCCAACTRRLDVVGEAMTPTFKNGESAILAMALDSLERADIVAFRSPHDESKHFLSRIIGLPGERIEMADGQVSIGGRLLEEAYVVDANRSSDTWGPLTIPEGEYFVMGDNRRNSFDSRSFGTVRRNSIYAKALTR